ncbi:MAG: DUF4097 family beta strand repeat-containing protein [Romboutsia sp.]
MNKRLTIFAVVLIAIGIIGTISSSIAAVPFATNYVNESIKKANEEVQVYEKKLDINKLNIETKNLSVEIRKSDSDKLKIVQLGNFNNKTLTVENNDKTFTIKENNEVQHIDVQIQGFGDAILNLMKMGPNKIIIYVPNNVDIQANTNGGSLEIDDKDILLNQVVFATRHGQISLPKEVKQLDSLKISSTGNLDLKASELLGIKTVDISTQSDIYIESMPDDMFIDSVGSFIPETCNIIADRCSPTIHIQSNIPIAKNLNIDNKSGNVYIDLPTDYYNINFNLNTLNGIYYDENNGYDNQGYNENNTPMKKFEGSFREAKENEAKYNVNINSDEINLIKK